MDSPPPVRRRAESGRQKYRRATFACALWFNSLFLSFASFDSLFANLIVMHAAQFQRYFFVIDQLFARGAGQGIILHQENRSLRTYLLAIAAETATKHLT